MDEYHSVVLLPICKNTQPTTAVSKRASKYAAKQQPQMEKRFLNTEFCRLEFWQSDKC